MLALILGLVLFLGVHSSRILAEGYRRSVIERRGQNVWKGIYSVLSIAGFVLVVWGYGAARQEPIVLWASPTWVRHLASLLTLASFVLLVAAYVPRNAIKARLHHPMVLGVKAWALAHLLANNTAADLVLFGGFLAWSIFSFRAARARDRAAGTTHAPGTLAGTAVTLVAGLGAWAVFAFWGHQALIGVRPFG
jgi:uncharacterized membrane protein